MVQAEAEDPGFVAEFLSPELLVFSREIFDHGETIEKFMVSWCIQNLVPLRLLEAHSEWVVVTYEELLIRPDEMAALLADRLELTDLPRIASRMGRSSRTTFDPESADVLANETDLELRRAFLLGRWRERMSAADKARCARVLEAFDIDDYRLDSLSPSPRLLNFPESARDLDAI